MDAAKLKTQRARGRPSLTEVDIVAGRARIAAVAEALFRMEGYAAVSMRRLAQEAGCAPMTLYAYFASKADILRQIWAQFFVELFGELNRKAARVSGPRKRLLLISKRYVRYWLDHPDRYRMVFMTEGVSQADVGKFIGAGSVISHFAIFAETLHAAGIKAASLKLMSESLICALNGIAHNHVTISEHEWESAERLAETVVHAILALPGSLREWK
jgi:AcrR family transcriptional regulator